MIKACLFSLDGVIVDTARCRFLAWKRLAAELGFEFTELQNESLRGVSRFEALGILLRAGGLTGRFDVGQKVRMASCQAGWYREYVGRMTEADVLPGAVSLLEGLRREGISVGLGSGRSRCAGDSRTNGYPFPVRLRIRRKPRLVCQVRSGTAFATSGAARGRSFGVRCFRLRSGRYRGGAEGRNAKRRRRRSLPVTRGDGRHGFARRIYRRRFAVADPRAKQEVRVAASSCFADGRTAFRFEPEMFRKGTAVFKSVSLRVSGAKNRSSSR